MIHIKRFNENSVYTDDIYFQRMKTIPFSKLPIDAKKSLITIWSEGDRDEINSAFDFYGKEPTMEEFISYIDENYGDKNYKYGFLPVEYVKYKIMQNDDISDNYNTFDEYHKDYYDGTNHGESFWPIYVDLKNDEFIFDGWHRFHYYITRGMTEIPCISNV